MLMLRAMETAGKQVEDEELRDLMKENGIGRPSTRAGIIETLLKRQYIRKDKKRLLATATGVELIATIRNELLKSAELTGQWEKKLRMIEDGKYAVADFMEELKAMVNELVHVVKTSPRRTITVEEPAAAGKEPSVARPAKKPRAEELDVPELKEGERLEVRDGIEICPDVTRSFRVAKGSVEVACGESVWKAGEGAEFSLSRGKKYEVTSGDGAVLVELA